MGSGWFTSLVHSFTASCLSALLQLQNIMQYNVGDRSFQISYLLYPLILVASLFNLLAPAFLHFSNFNIMQCCLIFSDFSCFLPPSPKDFFGDLKFTIWDFLGVRKFWQVFFQVVCKNDY